MRSLYIQRKLMASAKALGSAAVVVVCTSIAAVSANAATVHSGTDGFGLSTNSDAAYAAWQGQVVGGGLSDELSTMTCSGASPNVCTSGSNKFSGVTGFGSIYASEPVNTPVTADRVLQLAKGPFSGSDPTGRFIWDIAGPGVDAFGFFVHDNDGGLVTIKFNDGTVQTFGSNAFNASGDNMFWGITGLAGNVTSIEISASDPGGLTSWDNFVVGTTVPVPAALPLFLSALAAVGLVARRRRRVGSPA